MTYNKTHFIYLYNLFNFIFLLQMNYVFTEEDDVKLSKAL